MSNEKITIIRPVVDNNTGQTIIDVGTQGEILAFTVDPGDPGSIPVLDVPNVCLRRRLKFEVQFEDSTYFLAYPENFRFNDPLGLIKTIAEGATIDEVCNLDPTPNFQSKVGIPFSVTFKLDNDLKMTVIADHTSGILNLEVDTC